MCVWVDLSQAYVTGCCNSNQFFIVKPLKLYQVTQRSGVNSHWGLTRHLQNIHFHHVIILRSLWMNPGDFLSLCHSSLNIWMLHVESVPSKPLKPLTPSEQPFESSHPPYSSPSRLVIRFVRTALQNYTSAIFLPFHNDSFNWTPLDVQWLTSPFFWFLITYLECSFVFTV